MVNQALLSRTQQISSYIKDRLIALGADEQFITLEGFYDRGVLLEITSVNYLARVISFFAYKKRDLNYILVPLSLADDDLKKKLTKVTSWKGHFEFVSTSELDTLTPFFKAFIEDAESKRDFYFEYYNK